MNELEIANWRLLYDPAVTAAAHDHRTSLVKPAKSADEYLTTLEAQGLTQTVSVFREYMF